MSFALQALFVQRFSKKVSEPDYLYDLPSHLLFPENLNLEEEEADQDDTINHISHVTTKQPKQPKHSKSKSTTVPVSSPPPISSVDSGAKLTYDQQIQHVQLQKEKLQLELQVLTLSRQERPQENMCEGFAEDVPVTEPITQRRPNRPIDWPHDFVPSVQGEYDKSNLSEFVTGFFSYDQNTQHAVERGILGPPQTLNDKTHQLLLVQCAGLSQIRSETSRAAMLGMARF